MLRVEPSVPAKVRVLLMLRVFALVTVSVPVVVVKVRPLYVPPVTAPLPAIVNNGFPDDV
jgi:hypothetical protein